MEGLEAKHWARDPLYETVVLFNDVVEVFDLEDFDRGSRTRELQDDVNAFETRQIGPALVDGDLLGDVVQVDRALEEAPCGRHVALGREHEVHRPAKLVDGAVKVFPLAAHRHVGLVHPPRRTYGELATREHACQHR